MTYPTQSEVEQALIDELRRRGKATRPMDLYEPLADRFGLSQEERTRARHDDQPGGEWSNRVQWARRRLVDRGIIVHEPYKPWALTEWSRNL